MTVTTYTNTNWFNNLTSEGALDNKKICSHCDNKCTVLVDDPEFFAPCPACSGGMARNHNFYGEGDPCWGVERNANDYKWNNGLSTLHRDTCKHRKDDGNTCFEATTSGKCVWHRKSREQQAEFLRGFKDAFQGAVAKYEASFSE